MFMFLCQDSEKDPRDECGNYDDERFTSKSCHTWLCDVTSTKHYYSKKTNYDKIFAYLTWTKDSSDANQVDYAICLLIRNFSVKILLFSSAKHLPRY